MMQHTGALPCAQLPQATCRWCTRLSGTPGGESCMRTGNQPQFPVFPPNHSPLSASKILYALQQKPRDTVTVRHPGCHALSVDVHG